MMRRFFSSQTKTITGAALMLGAASFVSRLMGVVRDRTFANLFSAGDTLDAYYAAFRIPDFIYSIVIVGALSAGFIPVFTKALHKNKDEAWTLVNTILSIIAVSTFVLGCIIFLLAPFIIHVLVPGFPPAKQADTVMLTRIMCLSPMILGLSSIVSGVLQSYKNFFIYALSPILYNVGIIFGAIFLVPIFGISGLALGVLIGAILHLSIQIPTLMQHGFRLRPNFSWRDRGIKSLGTTIIPRMLDLAVAEINFMIITAFASTLGSGSISAFQFANNLQSFPIGIIGVSFAIAAFPTLSQFIAEDKQDDMRQHLNNTIQQIIFFIIPVVILFLLLRAQIVRVVLGSGAFDWTATINTANVLGFFSLSLFAQCLMPLLVRAFFALEDTWTPFYTSLASMAVNIGVSAYLLHYNHAITIGPLQLDGIASLGFAFSISMIVEFSLLWITLRSKLGSLHDLTIIKTLAKISVAAAVMAYVVQALKLPISNIVDMNRFWGIFTQGAISGISGLAAYILIAYALDVTPMLQFKASLSKRWLKLKNIPSDFHEPDASV